MGFTAENHPRPPLQTGIMPPQAILVKTVQGQSGGGFGRRMQQHNPPTHPSTKAHTWYGIRCRTQSKTTAHPHTTLPIPVWAWLTMS